MNELQEIFDRHPATEEGNKEFFEVYLAVVAEHNRRLSIVSNRRLLSQGVITHKIPAVRR